MSTMSAHRERSRCPIAFSLDVVGDRWTLLVLRDIALLGRRYFGDFLAASERISSKTLTDRLQRLERAKLIVRVPDPADQRRARYFLTDDGLDFLPVLIEMAIWGSVRHPTPRLSGETVERMRSDRAGTIAEVRGAHEAERRVALESVDNG
jgi:DNA-binding HxlR family transcriptional regulator